jgi:hypothetical protein
MQRSTSRILTTHTGSLPRSIALQELLRLREERRPYDQAAFANSVRTAVADVVQQQISLGLDVINDGEQERSQYAAYVKERLTGENACCGRGRDSAMRTSPSIPAPIRVPLRFHNRHVPARLPGRTGMACSGILPPSRQRWEHSRSQKFS